MKFIHKLGDHKMQAKFDRELKHFFVYSSVFYSWKQGHPCSMDTFIHLYLSKVQDSYCQFHFLIYTRCVHCWKIYNLFVRALEMGRPVSQRVQINYIFIDNVCILCLSCNIKNSKTPAKLSGNNWNKHRSNCFQWRHDRITLKFIWPPLILLKITQYRNLKMCQRPAISLATSGWVPSTNLSKKIIIEVGKTERLSRYLLFSRSLL